MSLSIRGAGIQWRYKRIVKWSMSDNILPSIIEVYSSDNCYILPPKQRRLH